MSAFLVLFMQYLPQIIAGGQDLYNYAMQVKAAAQQSGEWTDAQDKAWNDTLDALKSNPPSWLQTDDQLPPS
jgi:hypothetical protein